MTVQSPSLLGPPLRPRGGQAPAVGPQERAGTPREAAGTGSRPAVAPEPSPDVLACAQRGCAARLGRRADPRAVLNAAASPSSSSASYLLKGLAELRADN